MGVRDSLSVHLEHRSGGGRGRVRRVGVSTSEAGKARAERRCPLKYASIYAEQGDLALYSKACCCSFSPHGKSSSTADFDVQRKGVPTRPDVLDEPLSSVVGRSFAAPEFSEGFLNGAHELREGRGDARDDH